MSLAADCVCGLCIYTPEEVSDNPDKCLICQRLRCKGGDKSISICSRCIDCMSVNDILLVFRACEEDQNNELMQNVSDIFKKNIKHFALDPVKNTNVMICNGCDKIMTHSRPFTCNLMQGCLRKKTDDQ